MQTLIVERGDPDTDETYRRSVEHVANTYRQAFAADAPETPPRVAVALTREGRIACAAGIRCHHEGFFSRHYLDEPVCDALGRRTGLRIAPESMLEVGGLACASPFAVYPTLQAVFDWGRARDISWGLFTATASVRRLIARARIAPLLLTRAEASRVPDPERWGSYYANDPWVCAFRDPAADRGEAALRAETA